MIIPKNINREHIMKALQEIESSDIPNSRKSTGYDLVYDGKLYPPKYVISLANKYANGEELDRTTFHGGEETNSFLENLEFTIVKKKGYTLDEIKFDDCFKKYIDACKNTDWLKKHEIYKFRFAHWLYPKINFDTQSDEDIKKICEESQKQTYRPDSSEKGINFILAQKRYQDEIISLDDIRILRKLYKGVEPDKELFDDLQLSFPKFSTWLATVIPYEYYTYASNELRKSLN